MDTDAPAVTIILPTYNRAGMLRQAVDSVLAQTWQSWELFIIDDGSTDSSRELVSGLGDPRIHFLAWEHTGNPARLRNLAAQGARGEYLAFLDSDDQWLPEKLAVQLPALQAARGCRWSYSDVHLMDADGRELPKDGYAPWSPVDGSILAPLLVHRASIACPTVVCETRLFREVGGFDDSLPFCEDYELWLRFAVRSPVCAIPSRLARVRLHPGSNTYGRREVNECFALVYDRLRHASREPEIRALCRSQAAYYLLWVAWYHLSARSHAQAWKALAEAFVRTPMDPRLWQGVAQVLQGGTPTAAATR